MTTTVEDRAGFRRPRAELGPTLMHEHIVTRSPGRAGELAAPLRTATPFSHLAERKMTDLYSRGLFAIIAFIFGALVWNNLPDRTVKKKKKNDE